MQLHRPSFLVLARIVSVLLAVGTAHVASSDEAHDPIDVGIIGLDTSHVISFTRAFNESDEGDFKNMRVVAAYPGGSPDLEISAGRIDGFTKQVREEFDVEIVDSIAALLAKVDVVLLESVDGRTHLEQIKPVLEAGKPVFIDKPIAASLADTIEIFQAASHQGVPCFSSSSLRFNSKLQSIADSPELGTLTRCDASGPLKTLKGHPELFFYGIHGIEMMFTVMGPGCESVTYDNGVVTGVWDDGKIGTYREGDYGVRVTGGKGEFDIGREGKYNSLVNAIAKFFRSGRPPVASEETINLVAFMTAAEESKARGGEPVTIESVMTNARKQLNARK